MSGHKDGGYHSACPVCGGNDRFHVWPDQNEGAGSFWCRQCQIGGDSIQFLIETEGISFKEAAAKMGRTITEQKYSAPKPARKKIDRQFTAAASGMTAGEIWQQKAAKF